MRARYEPPAEAPELGWGASTLIENEPRALFARRSDWQGSTVFAVHNLSAEPVTADESTATATGNSAGAR